MAGECSEQRQREVGGGGARREVRLWGGEDGFITTKGRGPRAPGSAVQRLSLCTAHNEGCAHWQLSSGSFCTAMSDLGRETGIASLPSQILDGGRDLRTV